MRTRENPLPTPDDTLPRVVSVEHPSLPGKQYFKLPSFALAGVALQHFDSVALLEVMTNEGGDVRQQLAKSLLLAADCSALMGLCWLNPGHELETPAFTRGTDWHVYGGAVGDEIEDAGYPLIGVIACGAAIYGALYARLSAVGQEASEQADSFETGTAPLTGP